MHSAEQMRARGSARFPRADLELGCLAHADSVLDLVVQEDALSNVPCVLSSEHVYLDQRLLGTWKASERMRMLRKHHETVRAA
eukprot:15433610-Alexandrium_andersonii.AAC.1